MSKDNNQGLRRIFNLNLEANQKEMAVSRAEIQMETKRSSIPSFLAINMPPPIVTIQTGH